MYEMYDIYMICITCRRQEYKSLSEIILVAVTFAAFMISSIYSCVLCLEAIPISPSHSCSNPQEYIDYNGGPGVQHIALRTADIMHTVAMLKQRGVKFLKVGSFTQPRNLAQATTCI